MNKEDKNRMRSDVSFLTGIWPSRNWQHLKSLEIIANYIQEQFEKVGLELIEQLWTVKGNSYRNVIASYNADKKKRLIIGAHYDVFGDLPGADDNASGIAGLLETARLVAANRPETDYRIDFVAYCLEEPPFFNTEDMGSYVHAKSLNKEKVKVLGMICYEMIGYYSEAELSQPNPLPEFLTDIPTIGNFICVLGIREFSSFKDKVYELMLENKEINTIEVTLPLTNELVALSDHRNYWNFGYPAIMITDTAKVRNRHNYHQESDTIDTLDFVKMSEVVNSTYIALTNLQKT